MAKLGSQYIDTPMTFEDVPFGVKFTCEGGYLCKKYNPLLRGDNKSFNAIEIRSYERYSFSSDLPVVAWMPKSLLAQREREKTDEWKRRMKEIRDGIDEYGDCEEPELIIGGEREPRLRFIPVR